MGKEHGEKGSNDIHVLGVENKRHIIIVVSFAIDGSSLPLQVIFTRSTTRCFLQNGKGKVSYLGIWFDLTHFANHWFNLNTCK